jgi:putative redox protein
MLNENTVSHQDEMRFEAKTEKSSFIIDCPQISPIEYFLSGIITCSATDVVLLPKQQGYEVINLEVSGEVVRNESAPKKFNTLHLEYRFDSNADDTSGSSLGYGEFGNLLFNDQYDPRYDGNHLYDHP